MSVKHIVLLLIFLVNTIGTVMADSIHIEIESHTTSSVHSDDHHDHSKNSSNEDEHCPDHDGCHNGHYHHFLINSFTPSIVINFSSEIAFLSINNLYSPNSLEIIKPPLLPTQI